ncbi:MAG: DUF3168 domain-containing protein [Alphaproteobacteria bacterium]|nr:DUF3168 domain-containing protein [Alphaproteobacteria bacterium]
MTDALLSVQQAVTNALSSSLEVQAVLGQVPQIYDHVPPGAIFPYVAFGPTHVEPYDTKTETGFEQIVTLNIWSRYRGGKETRDIFQALYDTLHRAPLTVAGEVFLSSEFHSADFSLDSDGLTYHAAARFSIVTQSS